MVFVTVKDMPARTKTVTSELLFLQIRLHRLDPGRRTFSDFVPGGWQAFVCDPSGRQWLAKSLCRNTDAIPMQNSRRFEPDFSALPALLAIEINRFAFWGR